MKYIIFSFIAFVLFIGALVTICVRQNIPLVSANYYEEDLRYNRKMEQKKNAHELTEQPIISVANEQLNVSYAQIASVQEGFIKLMRPSDSRFDQVFEFNNTLGANHNFIISQPQKGLYRVSIQWKMNDKEYFMEKNIVL